MDGWGARQFLRLMIERQGKILFLFFCKMPNYKLNFPPFLLTLLQQNQIGGRQIIKIPLLDPLLHFHHSSAIKVDQLPEHVLVDHIPTVDCLPFQLLVVIFVHPRMGQNLLDCGAFFRIHRQHGAQKVSAQRAQIFGFNINSSLN